MGEVRWEQLADSTKPGGAPLNFAAHLKRLRHDPVISSAVCTDIPGTTAGSTRSITRTWMVLGDGDDVRPLGAATELMADVIVNHMSSR